MFPLFPLHPLPITPLPTLVFFAFLFLISVKISLPQGNLSLITQTTQGSYITYFIALSTIYNYILYNRWLYSVILSEHKSKEEMDLCWSISICWKKFFQFNLVNCGLHFIKKILSLLLMCTEFKERKASAESRINLWLQFITVENKEFHLWTVRVLCFS